MSSCSEHYARIQLYVDGELAKDEREYLFSHLENCAECQQFLEEAEAFSLRIRAARPSSSAPESLRSAVMSKMQETRGPARPTVVPIKSPRTIRLWPLTAVAAALAVFAVGLFAFHSHQQNDKDPMIQAAVMAHQQLQQNAIPLDVASDSPQVVSSWFANRVSFPFRMANQGMAADDRAKYKLTGGRLLTVGADRTALLSFSMAHDVVSLLVGPGHLSTASGGAVVQSDGIDFHSHDQDSLHVVTWNNRGLSYVLTSTRPMENTRKCSACHEERVSDKEAPHQAATWNHLRQHIRDDSAIESAKMLIPRAIAQGQTVMDNN